MSSLQRFHDDVSAAVRSLEARGVNPTSYESLLLPNLLKRCPDEFRLELLKSATQAGVDCDSIKEFLRLLSADIEVREKAAVIGKRSGHDRDRLACLPKPSLSTLAVHSDPKDFSRGSAGRVYCTYCGLGHSSEA